MKVHWIPNELLAELEVELGTAPTGERRVLVDSHQASRAYLDLPGMAVVGRSIVETHLTSDGADLVLRVPAVDFAQFFAALESASSRRRTSTGTVYHVLIGWRQVVCLTLAMVQELCNQWRLMQPTIAQIAREETANLESALQNLERAGLFMRVPPIGEDAN